jgi:DNA invertase Pin-like site-specific DNA recombinase
MALIGYCRVSTTEQNLDRQLEALQEYGCAKIYSEKQSGTKIDRPELQKMLKELKKDDIVVVKELTRVSRSTSDLLNLVNSISNKGASIKSLQEGWLDTSTPSGKFMLTVFAGMSEFELELRRQRCEEGIAIAKKNGVKFGRPVRKDKSVEYAVKMAKEGKMSVREIAEVTGVSHMTIYRRLRKEVV